jgi:hypothetical protein
MRRFQKAILCLSLLIGAALFSSQAQAGAAADTSLQVYSRPAATPLFAGITDGIIGNRSRMIQTAFIGFAIGVFILMTATRKH